MDKNEIYDYLIDNEIATQGELDLITNINGFSEKTLNDVIYSKTGYNDIGQLLGE